MNEPETGNQSRVRAKVEHLFGIIKRQFEFSTVRYRGLNKNRSSSVRGLRTEQPGDRQEGAAEAKQVRPTGTLYLITRDSWRNPMQSTEIRFLYRVFRSEKRRIPLL